MTEVVHCKKTQGGIYIGRPSQWGNPFEIGKDGDRETVIEKYIAWFFTQNRLLRDIPKLKDKTLSYWGAPLDCHISGN